jgi:hypothetical protein
MRVRSDLNNEKFLIDNRFKMSREIQVLVISFRWTYTAAIDKEWFDNHENLIDWCKENGKSWVFQLEKTIKEDGTDNLHYQGYISLKTKERPKALAIRSNDEYLGINCQACSAAGRHALSKYCMKAETRVAGPWSDHPVYMGDDLPLTLCPWQQQVVDIINHDVHPRRIYWFYDTLGGSGKSTFAKYLAYHHNVMKLTHADAGSLLYQVATGTPRNAYIFDLSRSKGSNSTMNDIYQAIEAVKDGHFCCSKYESKEVIMRKPHVFVFSNSPPDMKCISVDRLYISSVALPPSFQPNVVHFNPVPCEGFPGHK